MPERIVEHRLPASLVTSRDLTSPDASRRRPASPEQAFRARAWHHPVVAV